MVLLTFSSFLDQSSTTFFFFKQCLAQKGLNPTLLLYRLYCHANWRHCTIKRSNGSAIALRGGRSGASSAHMGRFAGKSHLKWWQTLNRQLVRGPIPPASTGGAVAPRRGAPAVPGRVFAATGDRRRGQWQSERVAVCWVEQRSYTQSRASGLPVVLSPRRRAALA